MKRFASISLLFLYLGIHSGLGLDFHFCGNQFSSVALAGMDVLCCCGDEEEEMDCCSTETVVLQSDEEQQNAIAVKVPPAPVALLAAWDFDLDCHLPPTKAETTPDRGPPDPGIPLYISLSRLTFYG